MDCSAPGSSIHGIFQARILEWVAISFSKPHFLVEPVYCDIIILLRVSLVAQTVKHLPEMQETQVRSLGQGDSLEKEMATHSSILA